MRTKPKAKDYYHFNAKLATAPKAVQDVVSKIRALPYRSGKQGKLQQLATAFAKSIEQLETTRAQKKRGQGIPQAGHGHKMWWRRGL